jgi:hypothetical protein
MQRLANPGRSRNGEKLYRKILAKMFHANSPLNTTELGAAMSRNGQ